jgi:hypothetical protein
VIAPLFVDVFPHRHLLMTHFIDDMSFIPPLQVICCSCGVPRLDGGDLVDFIAHWRGWWGSPSCMNSRTQSNSGVHGSNPPQDSDKHRSRWQIPVIGEMPSEFGDRTLVIPRIQRLKPPLHGDNRNTEQHEDQELDVRQVVRIPHYARSAWFTTRFYLSTTSTTINQAFEFQSISMPAMRCMAPANRGLEASRPSSYRKVL